jgi:hypothetical protein
MGYVNFLGTPIPADAPAAVRRGLILGAAALLLACAGLGATGVQSADAVGAAYFPSTPTAVQVTRNLSLQEAAQDGVLLLGAKGGYEGDSVLLELAGQQVRGPITVTVHEEMWAESNHSDEELGRLQKKLEKLASATEAELNRPHYKTRRGEPINFVMDWKFRKEDEPEAPNYNQVLIVEPLMDFEKPDPLWRTHVDELGVPNSPGTVEAEFAYEDLKPGILAHETLHMVGLDDRYSDIYVYKGREIPLPSNGMSTTELTAYLKTVKPPVPAPPAGNVGSKNTPGTKRCDIMGTGALLSCRKLSKRDLKLIESEAGVSVEAKPGEVLLNKDRASQNLVVGYPTHVFAGPGETTVAPGVSTYCIDHKKLPPSGSSFPVGAPAANFDVGPPASTLPGFEAVGKLAELNAGLQPSLTEPVPAVQNALWNQTDGTALTEEAATPEQIAQTRELLSKVGAGENTSGQGPTHLEDPNAGAATTGAVDASGNVLPTEPAKAAAVPPSIRIATAALEPRVLPAARPARSTLVLATSGEVLKLELKLQSHVGHRWRSVKNLPGHKLEPGSKTFGLNFGRLAPGKYRLLVTVSGPSGEAETAAAPLTVRAKS